MDSNVVERLRKLKEEVEGLKSYGQLSLDAYLENTDRQLAIERRLHLACQVCIDIGNYLIAYYGLKTPEKPENIFAILARENLLPKALGEKMVGVIRFRNILVHGYLEIDPAKVYAVFANELGAFVEFADAIRDLFERDNQVNGAEAE